MYLLMIFIGLSITLMLIMSIMIMMISKKSILDYQKLSPFECGFNPMSNKRLPFSVHFFMVAIIFLVFDIEIIIIVPMSMTIKFTNLIYWSITTMTFIMILIMGLYYEWYFGMLNWYK